MNTLIGLLIALGISLVGNLWLFNARENVIRTNVQLETRLNTSNDAAQLCSDSVAKLQLDAEAAKKANAKALEAARNESKGKQAQGQKTLSKPRTVPADECASTEALLNEWFANRARK